MDISVRLLDEWTFECPMDISVVQQTNGHLNVQWTFLLRPMDEWTFVQWTVLFVQWTNGHLFMSNGHVTFTMPRKL